MIIEYDKEVDALYISIKEKPVHTTKEIEDGINIDLDEDGHLIGIEILEASKRYTPKELFTFEAENLMMVGGS